MSGTALTFELHAGLVEEPFTCGVCEKEQPAGVEAMEILTSDPDRTWGPLCVDCWAEAPELLKHLASQSGLSTPSEALKWLEEQIVSRYRAAKGETN
jgi:hypothetical protein